MANFSTSVLHLNNLSGTSFTINVAPLQLSTNLNETDFLVLHDGVEKTSLYTKTNTNSISYAGPNVQLGTIVQVQRLTPLLPSDTTFLSLSTAAALTNGLSRLRLRTNELYAFLFYIVQQLQANGVNLGPIPVIDEPYGFSWDSDTLNAPSRNSVYDRFNQLLTGSNTFTGSYNFSGSSSLLVPTPPNNDNSTKAASTAFVESKKQEIITGSNTYSGNNNFAGATTLSGTTTLAGSSSFTGSSSFSNTASFSSTTTVPTISDARNSSTNAASTAFVQNAIYSNTWVVATCNNNPSLVTGSVSDLPLNSTIHNQNSSYNTSTYVWTCPETGLWKISLFFVPFAINGTVPSHTDVVAIWSLENNSLIQKIAGNSEQKQFSRASGSIALNLTANTQYKVRYLITQTGGSGFTYYLKQNNDWAPFLIIERIA
jgi:hypothetical protein